MVRLRRSAVLTPLPASGGRQVRVHPAVGRGGGQLAALVRRVVLRVLPKMIASTTAAAAGMARRKRGRTAAATAAGPVSAAGAAGIQERLRELRIRGRAERLAVSVVLRPVQHGVAAVDREPRGERDNEEEDDAADEGTGHQVELQLRGQVEGDDAEEDDERDADHEVLEESDGQPGQHEAGEAEEGAAEEEQVDGDVDAADAEGHERHVLRVGADVVNQLEDGESGKKSYRKFAMCADQASFPMQKNCTLTHTVD